MKFELVAPDHDYSSAMVTGCVNGGTVWLDNMAQALRKLGHEAEMRGVTQYLNLGKDIDYVIVQSEHIYFEHIRDFADKGGKIIALMGHFKDDHPVYAGLDTVKGLSNKLFTPWSGPCAEGIDLLPHAYNDLSDDRKRVDRRGSVVFAGNTYSLRNESWLRGRAMFKELKITRIYKTLPKDLYAVYRGADVCVNLHGDFQKNIVVDDLNRLSDKPGMMINERFWQVLGAGGLLVTDWVPQMGRWFREDELIVAHSKEEFYDLVTYYQKHKKEGLAKLQTAIQRVRDSHTYRHRMADMLPHLC